MNEITKIHLGRQPFVVAVDAYKHLQEYLLEIKKQAGKNGESVVEEVEARMAELLAERGITGDRVVLLADVAFLKEQLGSPRDFKEDDDDAGAKNEGEQDAQQPRRLFRDTERGMVAGVSAGLASYLNIDPVIIRILFVVTTLAAGWGILLYIVMWIVMPEAKTASERLQMRGKAVTVDSLKELVDRADVTGAAQRASRSMVTVFETVGKIFAVITGIVLVALAVGLLAGVGTMAAYALLHGGQFVQGAVSFPVGTIETVAAWSGLIIVTAILLIVLFTGMAMIRRKWIVPGWVVAAACGVVLIATVVCGAAMPDTINNVRDRYEANSHTVTRQFVPFDKVRVVEGGTPIAVRYVSDSDAAMPDSEKKACNDTPEATKAALCAKDGRYRTEIRYVGDLPVDDIKTTVQDGTLVVDKTAFQPGDNWDCDVLCIGNRDYFEMVIHTPYTLRQAE